MENTAFEIKKKQYNFHSEIDYTQQLSAIPNNNKYKITKIWKLIKNSKPLKLSNVGRFYENRCAEFSLCMAF